MNMFTKEDLGRLMDTQSWPHVSIYMPAHRESDQAQQDPIRLKNLLKAAEQHLLDNKLMEASEAETLLKPALALLDDQTFWQHQSDGLALFLSAEESSHYRLPLSFEELVVVEARFHIKPMLPLFNNKGRFYILALSQNDIRLFAGTRHTVDQIDLEGVPTSLAEALPHDDPERQLQHHIGEKVDTTAPGIFHGHGVGAGDFKKDNILRFFQQVDKGICALLEDQSLPLVLAGVDYLLPIYKEASNYPHLIDEGVTGNPDETSAQELHEQAWSLVQPYFREEREQATAEYRRLADGSNASQDLSEIVRAAHYGRVKVAFVATDVQRWGKFDAEKNVLEVHDNPEPGNADLLDSVAVQTLMHGGTVYSAEADEIPGGEPVAAVFRY